MVGGGVDVAEYGDLQTASPTANPLHKRPTYVIAAPFRSAKRKTVVKSTKKVLIVGSYAPSLIRFRGPLIEAMVDAGHSVAAAAPEIDKATASALRAIGAEPVNVPLRNASLNPLGLLRSVNAMRKLIRRQKPDVVIAYTIKPVITAALATHAERTGRMVALITGAGYAFTGGREIKRLISRGAASVLYRIALARSDVIIFQNRDDEALFRQLRLVPAKRESQVVNGSGVDLDHYAPAPLPEGASFLMIARLLRDKGIREFAEAAKRLKSAHPDVPVTLVGDVDPSPDSLSQAELEELVRCGIDYKGPLDDVRRAIAACSVYVLPSYREGTPRSVLEAMAMGRAIITTDAPGCRETVVDGENGLLVRPRDAADLFTAMQRFIRDPALIAPMGRRSLEIARAKYDVDAVNADLLRYAGLRS